MNRSAKPKQIDRIKADLLNGKPVDAVTAFVVHNITRLSAVIHRLRGQGWPISSEQDQGNGLARYAVPTGWRPPGETAGRRAQKKPVDPTSTGFSDQAHRT